MLNTSSLDTFNELNDCLESKSSFLTTHDITDVYCRNLDKPVLNIMMAIVSKKSNDYIYNQNLIRKFIMLGHLWYEAIGKSTASYIECEWDHYFSHVDIYLTNEVDTNRLSNVMNYLKLNPELKKSISVTLEIDFSALRYQKSYNCVKQFLDKL